jgi:uncharacterized protein HemY
MEPPSEQGRMTMIKLILLLVAAWVVVLLINWMID